MRRVGIGGAGCLKVVFGLFLLVGGLCATVFAPPIGWIAGPVVCLVGFSFCLKRKMVWKCEKCGLMKEQKSLALLRPSAEDFDAFYLHNNTTGVVTVHPSHLRRVSKILAQRYPGLIFIWSASPKSKTVDICAIRFDRRAIPDDAQEKLVAAGEKIALHVANKYPVRWWKPKSKPKSDMIYVPA